MHRGLPIMIARRMLLASALLVAANTTRAQANGVWIVSSAESGLPPSDTSKAGRSIGRGPSIRQVSPIGAVPANVPFDLRVEFAGRGGEKIAPATVQITLLRGSNVDITQRMKAYITPTGIAVPNAMVPAGSYVLQVVVSDADGHQSTANIEINAR